MNKILLAKKIEDIGVPIIDPPKYKGKIIELEELNMVQSQNGCLRKKANTSLKFILLAIYNKIHYANKNFLGVLIPPFVKWNWSAVMPQQFNRSANSSNLLTVLVPLDTLNNIYLHLIKYNIFIHTNNRKGEQ